MQNDAPIFFTHGNGFPNQCYSQLIKQLNSHYPVLHTEMLGHDPSYPITNNWPYLVDELLTSIDKFTARPVIGLGHSFGGVVTLLASLKRPALFHSVIMLDAPILTPFKCFVIRMVKRLGYIDYITPAIKVKYRKTYWPTRAEAKAYFKQKALFKNFNEACLDDYIRYGLKETESGFTLVFDREREYQIFRTLPDHLFKEHKRTTVPTGIVFGHHSDVISRADARYLSHNYQVSCFTVEGTHMFPFEAPEETATIVKKLIKQLQPV